MISYNTYADSVDADGHGTHVASSAAGSSTSTQYQGHAPDAKLSFFDIGIGPSLLVPPDLNMQLLQPLYVTGAAISTHSWGSSSSAYTVDARAVDLFMWTYPAALVLISG